MPWGLDRDQLEPRFSAWLEQPVKVHNVTFLFPRGFLRWLIPFCERRLPGFMNKAPGVCWLQLPERSANTGPGGCAEHMLRVSEDPQGATRR